MFRNLVFSLIGVLFLLGGLTALSCSMISSKCSREEEKRDLLKMKERGNSYEKV